MKQHDEVFLHCIKNDHHPKEKAKGANAGENIGAKAH